MLDVRCSMFDVPDSKFSALHFCFALLQVSPTPPAPPGPAPPAPIGQPPETGVLPQCQSPPTLPPSTAPATAAPRFLSVAEPASVTSFSTPPVPRLTPSVPCRSAA